MTDTTINNPPLVADEAKGTRRRGRHRPTRMLAVTALVATSLLYITGAASPAAAVDCG